MILASFCEPDSIFEVEDYFSRSIRELGLQEPLPEDCTNDYMEILLTKISNGEGDVLEIAYEMYTVVRKHFLNESLSVWYDISEKIHDLQYGDNIESLTKGALITTIVEEAKTQLKSHCKRTLPIVPNDTA
ncbi:hypothetical protein [Bacillus sp. mrc49]|uniref:hypothetical protein n=1 Tax=Bacillus sp. mrc49 TaxID=2054913 RepID=UPI000C271DB7|nr:hypothetical protein [Bacillus sp. mrc49]